MKWNAYIAVKGNGNLTNAHWGQVKQWAGVDAIWSATGEWDWWIKLNSNTQNMGDVEGLAHKLREQAWVTDTNTQWWKAIA